MSIETAGPGALPRTDDEQAIRKLTQDWLAAVRAKDIPRLAGMVTDDAVFLPPGFPPIRGKQAVEAMYQSFFPPFRSLEQTVCLEEVQVAGDWAFAWGTREVRPGPSVRRRADRNARPRNEHPQAPA